MAEEGAAYPSRARLAGRAPMRAHEAEERRGSQPSLVGARKDGCRHGWMDGGARRSEGERVRSRA